jgi:hypothetical protein
MNITAILGVLGFDSFLLVAAYFPFTMEFRLKQHDSFIGFWTNHNTAILVIQSKAAVLWYQQRLCRRKLVKFFKKVNPIAMAGLSFNSRFEDIPKQGKGRLFSLVICLYLEVSLRFMRD